MRFQTFVLIIFNFVLGFGMAEAGSAISAEELNRRFDQAIRKSGISKKNLGIVLTRRSGSKMETLLEINGARQMIPASLTKVFTAAAIFHHLDPNHKFVTEVFADEMNSKGEVAGHIYLKGGGDPSFVSESMWVLVNKIVRSGLSSVKGDIVVDDTLFDRDLFPGRDPNRVDRAYDAPIGAMSFNWNSVNIYIRPTTVGRNAKVFLDPLSEYLSLTSVPKTGKAGSRKRLKVSRTTQNGKDRISVKGSIPEGHEEVVVYKSISQPSLWSGHHFREFLRQRGIVVQGQVRRGDVSSSAKLVAENESKALYQVVADLMKFSNNYVAEMLIKSLSVQKGEQGNLPSGLSMIREYLTEVGLSAQNYHIENGSGLSRKNRIRPMDLAKVLGHLQGQFDRFPEYISALPIAGIDGTLKKRLNGGVTKRWVRAKTGMLNGVIGLAGYAGRRDGEVVTFAFLFNGKASEQWRARDLMDALATATVR